MPTTPQAASAAIEIGDAVAWADVPDGAMVRDAQGWHALRLRGRGVYVGNPDEEWLSANPWSGAGRWHWGRVEVALATVVALDLTGQESAADLQRLAEIFEVREALRDLPRELVALAAGPIDDPFGPTADDWAAPLLHALGWRKGMAAEEAWRLLSATITVDPPVT